MSLSSLYTDLQAADSIYVPPNSLEFQDPRDLVLAAAAVNSPVIRYQLTLRDLDGRAALLSCDQHVSVFRQAIQARLISTEDFIRSVYIDQFVRPLLPSPTAPPLPFTTPVHSMPVPHRSYSGSSPFTSTPLPPRISFRGSTHSNDAGINGYTGTNGYNGTNTNASRLAITRQPLPRKLESPLSATTQTSRSLADQNLERILLVATDQDYNRLNDKYAFDSVTSLSEFSLATFATNGSQRLIKDALSSLLGKFLFWKIKHLLALIDRHGIPKPARAERTLPSLYCILCTHECTSACSNLAYMFTELASTRLLSAIGSREHFWQTIRASAPHTEAPISNPTPQATLVPSPGLQAPSPELKRQIIQQWQEEMSTINQKNGVCAACSRRDRAVVLKDVPVEDVDFTLLWNPDIPDNLLPTNYNVVAYDKAILNTKGLSHSDRKAGTLKLCKNCHTSLKKGSIPRFSLANHLYYATDRLPDEVKTAFSNATLLERFLVSRARASRVTFRYCRKQDAPGFGGSIVTSQSYNKGNVIVYPQDAPCLNRVLPPSPQSVRDTFCALLIGAGQKPSRESIAELRPCLLRKSRVKSMIEFLIAHNPFYREDAEFSGFSSENLDALVSESQGDETLDTTGQMDCETAPSCIEITQLDTTVSAGEYEATADYTNRNVADANDNTDEDMSDLLLENVGYADADMSPADYRAMKLKALQHCLSGGKYVQSRSGSKPLGDFNNPNLLTWAYPHLDPWGIGGFHHPRRRKELSMEQQLSYLLSIDESPFASDPTFAFVYWSILQKKEVVKDCSFRLKQSQYTQMVDQLTQIPPQTLTELQRKLQINPSYRAQSPPECAALKMLSQLSVMNTHLRGSAGSKIAMRNEIRSLIQMYGVPALFITLNPSDVNNPLVRVIIGEDIVLEDALRGEDMKKFMRQKLAAKHPNATAIFFDRMIEGFFKIIVRYGCAEPGLFGKCIAYYGTVEAQGKGTLHCHILIWLDGHLSPQALRDKMLSDDAFKMQMFKYLESVIKCELPEDNNVVEEGPNGPLQPPTRPSNAPNPTVIALPLVKSMPPAAFDNRFQAVVSELVKECHWHYHNNTCWKYLKRGDPKDDAHCRMRIDGSTRAQTELDPETHSILLRRLHPRINNYNDVLTFLFQSNNDIKFIGSGEAAKALTYYVTDYITKTPLPTHVGLSALRAAIQSNTRKYDSNSDASPDQISKSLITKCANAILSRQEISHPQIMSYLIGGGDHYTSHTFQTLYWASFYRVVTNFFLPVNDPVRNFDQLSSFNGAEIPVIDSLEDDINRELEDSDEPSVTLRITQSGLSASKSSQYNDYVYRSNEVPFDSITLYDFIRRVKKIPLPRKTSPDALAQTHNSSDIEEEFIEETETRTAPQSGGRPRNKRGQFLASHPQFHTHQLREMSSPTVPVVLGPTIPHPDKNAVAKEIWSKAMLILFKPWREPLDLKSEDETWADALQRSDFDGYTRHVMQNFVVLHECKDARNNDMTTRGILSSVEGGMLDNRDERGMPGNAAEVQGDAMDFVGAPDLGGDESDSEGITEVADVDQNVAAVLLALSPGLPPPVSDDAHQDSSTFLSIDGPEKDRLKQHRTLMTAYRKRKRADLDGSDDEDEGPVRQRRRVLEVQPSVASMDLDLSESVTLGAASRSTTHASHTQPTPAQHIADIIREMNLESNEEQLLAFNIIARHFIDGSNQLLMHLGGVGGTGKSHVISAVVQLLQRLERSNELLLSAPTGAAAVLIRGSTIHSLTMLPQSSFNVDELLKIWQGVQYLFIDEISMVHARLLAQISERIRKGKGGSGGSSRELPFGGVNIIFTGDFGQLRPVGGVSFYSHELLNSLRVATAETLDGQTAVMGAFLWRQVNTVVILRQNQRQKGDPVYAGLLSRLRIGGCSPQVTAEPSFQCDYDLLQGRLLNRLRNIDPADADQFYDAPFIVGRRKLRDVLNQQLLKRAAAIKKKQVYSYHSIDKSNGVQLQGNTRVHVWKASSTDCDALGILDLFEGMKVMITENIAINKSLVNGAEGTVRKIMYNIDTDNRRYATACYVHVPGSGIIIPGEDPDVACIFPTTTSFRYTTSGQRHIKVSRTQLPLVPGYSYTDYKSQGRTLPRAVVDLASAGSLQGAYVMLSRVKTLDGVAILRRFERVKIEQRPSQELRDELSRLDRLHHETVRRYKALDELDNDYEDI